MKLFYMQGASSLAGHIVLEWVGGDYELVRMNRAALKNADYLALNPGGTVPLLLHGDFALTESTAILGYLSDLHPESELLGDGTPRARAETTRWLSLLNSDVTRAFKLLFSGDGPGAEERNAAARAQIRAYLARLESQLDGKEWLTGSRSIADAALFVVLRWAIGVKISLAGLEKLSAFVDRMHLDEAVHAALVAEEGLAPRPAAQAGAPGQLLQTISDNQSFWELNERLASGTLMQLTAEVVGPVEYREGDGALQAIRRGIVGIDIAGADTVFSWIDENYRGEAAIPYANFYRYVSEGAIRLAPSATDSACAPSRRAP